MKQQKNIYFFKNDRYVINEQITQKGHQNWDIKRVNAHNEANDVRVKCNY